MLCNHFWKISDTFFFFGDQISRNSVTVFGNSMTINGNSAPISGHLVTTFGQFRLCHVIDMGKNQR